jgi:hypothetical protein
MDSVVDEDKSGHDEQEDGNQQEETLLDERPGVNYINVSIRSAFPCANALSLNIYFTNKTKLNFVSTFN